MKYKIISNGLWENSKEVKEYKEIEKAIEDSFSEDIIPSEREFKLIVNRNGMKEFDRIFKEEVNKQLSELEQLEYLDRLSEQTI